MTTDRPVPPPAAPRRKRPHPAATARTVAAGLAAAGTCTLVVLFGLGHPSTATVTAPSSGSVTFDGSQSPATVAPPTTTPRYGQSTDTGGDRSVAAPSTGIAGRSSPVTRSSSS